MNPIDDARKQLRGPLALLCIGLAGYAVSAVWFLCSIGGAI